MERTSRASASIRSCSRDWKTRLDPHELHVNIGGSSCSHGVHPGSAGSSANAHTVERWRYRRQLAHLAWTLVCGAPT